MRHKPLVIVDAQADFIDESKGVLAVRNIVKMVKAARRARQFIFLVEMMDYGRSHKSVLNALKGYDRSFLTLKQIHDGSEQISQIARHLEIPFKFFTVCGFLLNCCVQKTAVGLFNSNYCSPTTVEVYLPACDKDEVQRYPCRADSIEVDREKIVFRRNAN